MALAAATVWEVRTAGSDTACSGGYVTGSAGTDYSQQNAAQYTGTDLAIDAVTNTKVTSASHNFVTADVGNLMRITAGTGYTTGFYQIASVAANAATLDRSPGAVGITGGTFAVGGALATPGLAVANMIAGHIIYATGGFTSTTNSSNVAGGRLTFPNVGTQAAWCRFIGYTATRGDGGKYVMTHGNTFTTELINSITDFVEIRNVELVGNATAGTMAFYLQGASTRAINIKISGYSGGGNVLLNLIGAATLKDFEISGGNTGALPALQVGTQAEVSEGWIHGNAGVGISCTGTSTTFERVISSDHTGANGKGFVFTGSGGYKLMGCGAWNNAQGDYILGNASGSLLLEKCVSGGGGVYNFDNRSNPDAIALFYCAAKANTTGLYPVTPNTNVGLVTLTGDPFTNSGAGDFSPDNTTNEGAALRGVAEVLFGLTTTYADIGPAEHQPTTGGGSGPNIIVSSGASSRGASW